VVAVHCTERDSHCVGHLRVWTIRADVRRTGIVYRIAVISSPMPGAVLNPWSGIIPLMTAGCAFIANNDAGATIHQCGVRHRCIWQGGAAGSPAPALFSGSRHSIRCHLARTSGLDSTELAEGHRRPPRHRAGSEFVGLRGILQRTSFACILERPAAKIEV
jgi:hypothetical protein